MVALGEGEEGGGRKVVAGRENLWSFLLEKVIVSLTKRVKGGGGGFITLLDVGT